MVTKGGERRRHSPPLDCESVILPAHTAGDVQISTPMAFLDRPDAVRPVKSWPSWRRSGLAAEPPPERPSPPRSRWRTRPAGGGGAAPAPLFRAAFSTRSRLSTRSKPPPTSRWGPCWSWPSARHTAPSPPWRCSGRCPWPWGTCCKVSCCSRYPPHRPPPAGRRFWR